MSQAAVDLLNDYHRFDDGWLLSFEYFFPEGAEPLSAQVVLYAYNDAENEWGKVKIVVEDVQELCAKVSGNFISPINLGVKLLKFGDLWCLDINGNYALCKDPASLDEVRQDGYCYIIGKSVTAHIIEKSQAISRDGKA
ncbi:MAG: hypothetical protein LBQ75_05900 [Zoogloeaceae bacterium]|jgi:hypothetical protein|nr:hypothetical protein [Zoogloeaceae bacterium]